MLVYARADEAPAPCQPAAPPLFLRVCIRRSPPPRLRRDAAARLPARAARVSPVVCAVGSFHGVFLMPPVENTHFKIGSHFFITIHDRLKMSHFSAAASSDFQSASSHTDIGITGRSGRHLRFTSRRFANTPPFHSQPSAFGHTRIFLIYAGTNSFPEFHLQSQSRPGQMPNSHFTPADQLRSRRR